MKLILKNKLIDAPIKDILYRIKVDTGGYYFKFIGDEKNENVKITCPFHKDGQEVKPSCFVYCKDDNPKVEYGFYKCFGCGEAGPLYKLVAHCLSLSEEAAKDWLIDNFSCFIEEGFNVALNTQEIILPNHKTNTKKFLDESILEQYNQYNVYMSKRKLTPEVLREFKIGFDSENEAITFPVWDEHGNLVMITERSVNTKRFYIPEGVEKPVYLLNYVKSKGFTEVLVCESQINTLTAWSWGYPAIGMIGTGSKYQYEILKRSGIRKYHLCFDGDFAGDKAIERFKKAMPDDVLIDVVPIPRLKDLNDLSKEEFEELFQRRFDK